VSKVYALVTSLIIVAIVATVVRNKHAPAIAAGGFNTFDHVLNTVLGNG